MWYKNKIFLAVAVFVIAVGGWWLSGNFKDYITNSLVDASFSRLQVEQLLGLKEGNFFRLIDWRGEQGRGYVLTAIVQSKAENFSLLVSFWPELESTVCDQKFFDQSMDPTLSKNWPTWVQFTDSVPDSRCFRATGQARNGSTAVDTAIWYNPQTELTYIREVGI